MTKLAKHYQRNYGCGLMGREFMAEKRQEQQQGLISKIDAMNETEFKNFLQERQLKLVGENTNQPYLIPVNGEGSPLYISRRKNATP